MSVICVQLINYQMICCVDYCLTASKCPWLFVLPDHRQPKLTLAGWKISSATDIMRPNRTSSVLSLTITRLIPATRANKNGRPFWTATQLTKFVTRHNWRHLLRPVSMEQLPSAPAMRCSIQRRQQTSIACVTKIRQRLEKWTIWHRRWTIFQVSKS